MTVRGRKPKPTETKKRTGNPGGRPLNVNEPLTTEGTPPKPDHLSEAASDEWDRLTELLDGTGLLRVVDQAPLVIYCEAWAVYQEASRQLQENGLVALSEKGTPYQSPYYNVMLAATKQLNAAAAELGLTPSSRSRITAVNIANDNNDDDFFD